ncbi:MULTISPECIES: hypothetical protein [Nostocales]|uniref:Uncharacterized protein n=1 Tax=Dolichospermum flos-aquae UHCC 0037 TaxID=2590026 RepID=A0ACC7S8N3_DOLFA|nr:MULTISPECIES: hypothetical protein [Nostocales]MBO1065145.1 hypothetical protein [Anabaena sp. 54]MTJ44873.1 hypothetical protein [Dolichospermum flos-aquae UHCC 0037]
MATKQELLDAYKGLNPSGNRELPVKIIQVVVEQIKSFILGDGYQKKIKLLAINPEQQEQLNLQLEQIKLYSLLQDVYLDVPVYGETYIEVSDGKLRHIRTLDVDDIKVDPLDPLKVVYLKESREIYDAVNNKYVKVKVEHYLTLPTENQTTLDLFNLPDYKYFVKVGDAEPVEIGDHIPIVRIVNSLDGRTAQSAIERLVHLQLEYSEVRSRINLNGKHHKPQVFTIGTSAPAIIGRTNSAQLESVESATGSAAFQTAFTSDAASILHLPISNSAAELGITPKIGYLQPVDSPYLERQRLIILQDIYSLTGVMVLELQNARSASSSSSLSVLYEPLKAATLSRANYLISAIKTIFLELGIDIPFRVELPDMMPRDLQDKKLQIEAVRHKLISRKRYLVEVEGLTEEEALKELEQLDNEKGLNIQYSAALTDSKDKPNTDENTLFEDSAYSARSNTAIN